MYAVTVHRPPQRVNTLYRVSSEQTPGSRLKAYIRARWTRKEGGWEALAKQSNLRGRQTFNEWFSGEKEPSLHSLALVAKALKVRTTDLVAAWEGVTAPETQRSAAPSMTRRLLAGVMALERNAQITEAEIARGLEAAEAFERLAQEVDRHAAELLEQSQRKSSGRAGGLGGGQSGASPGSSRRRRR